MKTLINGWQNSGKNAIIWDATNSLGQTVAAGVYLFVLDVGDLKQMRKMILLK